MGWRKNNLTIQPRTICALVLSLQRKTCREPEIASKKRWQSIQHFSRRFRVWLVWIFSTKNRNLHVDDSKRSYPSIPKIPKLCLRLRNCEQPRDLLPKKLHHS